MWFKLPIYQIYIVYLSDVRMVILCLAGHNNPVSDQLPRVPQQLRH